MGLPPSQLLKLSVYYCCKDLLPIHPWHVMSFLLLLFQLKYPSIVGFRYCAGGVAVVAVNPGENDFFSNRCHVLKVDGAVAVGVSYCVGCMKVVNVAPIVVYCNTNDADVAGDYAVLDADCVVASMVCVSYCCGW